MTLKLGLSSGRWHYLAGLSSPSSGWNLINPGTVSIGEVLQLNDSTLLSNHKAYVL
ncbi:MAG TPA: hypothetical protein V6D16_06255 [Candidatus Obscuribacterales bacterium]